VGIGKNQSCLVKAVSNTQMDRFTVGSLRQAKDMVMERIKKKTEKLMLESGKAIRKKGKENSVGQMGSSTLASSLITSERDLDF
jgi:hypothetical protein